MKECTITRAGWDVWTNFDTKIRVVRRWKNDDVTREVGLRTCITVVLRKKPLFFTWGARGARRNTRIESWVYRIENVQAGFRISISLRRQCMRTGSEISLSCMGKRRWKTFLPHLAEKQQHHSQTITTQNYSTHQHWSWYGEIDFSTLNIEEAINILPQTWSPSVFLIHLPRHHILHNLVLAETRRLLAGYLICLGSKATSS